MGPRSIHTPTVGRRHRRFRLRCSVSLCKNFANSVLVMTEIAFWCCVALVFYSYIGYPCALVALGFVRSRPVRRGPITPRVSFIITAHNEEARIAPKLENT